MKRLNWHPSAPTRALLLAGIALLLIIPLSLLETSAAATDLLLGPVFSHPGGYYEDDFMLAIDAPPDAMVVFTLNGRTPTSQTGTIYTQPLLLSRETAVTVIRARAILPDGESSPVVTASYFIGVESTLPLLSLVVTPDDLWDAETGIYANPLEKGIEWERSAAVAYVDKDRISGFDAPIGVRIHGGYTRIYDKKSFRLYFRNEYGLSWLDYPLFANSDLSSFKRLVLHSGAQDSLQEQKNWSMMRNPIVAEIALATGGYAAHSQPVLLFINGEPWGIYVLRERLDERFLATKYGIEAAEILDTPELDENRLRTDTPREHWDRLIQFVETHDLADPAHYDTVQTQIDIANFIDYNIIQIYSANIDWPQHNVNMFRPGVPGGRWHWMFWDNDSSLGLIPWSKVDTDMVTRALVPDRRDTVLFYKLMENPMFRDQFVTRAADLLNTALAPETVLRRLDALATELEPNILHESGRWGNGLQWQISIDEFRDFAQQRPDFMRQHLVERLGLKGIVTLSLNKPVNDGGYVVVNDHPLIDLSWHGFYFTGMEVAVTAVPHPDYRFVGWKEVEGGPDLQLLLETSQTLTPQFELASKGAP